MSKIVFTAISPHPPIILPSVGSKEDRAKVKKTIESLESLGKQLKEAKPDLIIISAPHPDWGIKVPLHFLISNIKNSRFHRGCSTKSAQKSKIKFEVKNYQSPDATTLKPYNHLTIYPILTTLDSPRQHYEWGKKFYQSEILNLKSKIAIIASGDLSHCLKEEGPYGFNPDGPKFDKELIDALKEKDIEKILKLDEMYPEAGECGLRSFCFLLGILEAWQSSSAGLKPRLAWQPEILSYESPFGVGYLVANFKLKI